MRSQSKNCGLRDRVAGCNTMELSDLVGAFKRCTCSPCFLSWPNIDVSVPVGGSGGAGERRMNTLVLEGEESLFI